MARIIYVTGGSRSGKSTYAQRTAETAPAPHVFVATCPVIDDEMNARIKKHQDHRDPSVWELIEEETDLAGAIQQAPKHATVLVDCLTLWINNLLYHAEQAQEPLTEEDVADKAAAVITAAKEHHGVVIIVSNELGMGIVPADAVTRKYRDLVGTANQRIAAAADSAIFMVSGIPMELKKQ